PADEDLETPLHYALTLGHLEAARLLLQHGHPPALTDRDLCTPLHHAAGSGHLEAVSLLLEHGHPLGPLDAACGTPAHAAAAHNQAAFLCLLHSLRPESVHLPNARGWTPLHSAAERGCREAVHSLLEMGADPTARTHRFETPMMLVPADADQLIRLLRNADILYPSLFYLLAIRFFKRDPPTWNDP
ncbi:MAG: ankyrin repeat domain-containing protein, partial [archaeon]|nr:ankyrin repeat domain-containing protein [archaeon]